MAHEIILQDAITIHAPITRCFLLSTSLELVQRELHMRPVEGRTSGLVVMGDIIRWQGWQLGLPQYHVSRIEGFDPPVFFRDRMIAGRFARFEHDHRFAEQADGKVLLSDTLRFTMPWSFVGDVAGYCLLKPHIRRLMRRRFAMLKQIAESDDWRRYLPDGPD